jgi:hypothetical protein
MTMINGIDRENLQRLATFLMHGNGVSKGVEFNMRWYMKEERQEEIVCKTSGCAVGFAPFAGIEKTPFESWNDYCKRTLIESTYDDPWHWCFSADWGMIDNTREGAAKRIQYFLDNGVPSEFDSYDAEINSQYDRSADDYGSEYVELYENTVVPTEVKI